MPRQAVLPWFIVMIVVIAMAPVRATPARAALDAHPDWLVSADWLSERLENGSTRVIAVEPADVFQGGHIPGAAHVEWQDLVLTDTSKASVDAWRVRMLDLLGAFGITTDTTVVVYDNGTLFGTRIWWMLDYFGHRDKRVLNGGYVAWYRAGLPVETGPAKSVPSTAYGDVSPHTSRLASWRTVASAEENDIMLIDARRTETFVVAHIPDAINVPRSDNAVRGSVGSFWLGLDDLAELYAEAGVSENQRIVSYSEEGMRASATYFALRMLGYDIALYPGSWDEWTARELPQESGAVAS